MPHARRPRRPRRTVPRLAGRPPPESAAATQHPLARPAAGPRPAASPTRSSNCAATSSTPTGTAILCSSAEIPPESPSASRPAPPRRNRTLRAASGCHGKPTGAVILAGNALEALSILSLHPVPAKNAECAVVSTAAVTDSIPKWIEAWNPQRIFCAWDATRNGDRAARNLIRKDTRIVRMRPALDNQDWNDMLIRDRDGEPLGTDDRPIN